MNLSTIDQLRRDLKAERERADRLMQMLQEKDTILRGVVEKNQQLRDTLNEIATMARKK